MRIDSFIGKEIITGESVEVAPDEVARTQVKETVLRAQEVTSVKDADEQEIATRVASELKGLHGNIEAQRKAAKGPVLAWERAIDNLASELMTPLEKELRRIQGMLAARVETIRREQENERRKVKEELERKIAEEQQRLAKLRQERLRAEADLRAANDAKAQAEAVAAVRAAAEAEAEEKAEQEIEAIDFMPRVPDVTPIAVKGARTVYDYHPVMTDLETVFKTNRRLLKIELRVSEVQALAKSLDVNNDGNFLIPGITVTKIARVDVKAASRTR